MADISIKRSKKSGLPAGSLIRIGEKKVHCFTTMKKMVLENSFKTCLQGFRNFFFQNFLFSRKAALSKPLLLCTHPL